MDTKEKILLASLELFSKDGYEAVSVSMIADALGITKGALYKHYTNKRDIFDSILRRMEENDRSGAERFSLPVGIFDEMPESYRNTAIEQLVGFTMAQFIYWTEDPFASRFRRTGAIPFAGDECTVPAVPRHGAAQVHRGSAA